MNNCFLAQYKLLYTFLVHDRSPAYDKQSCSARLEIIAQLHRLGHIRGILNHPCVGDRHSISPAYQHIDRAIAVHSAHRVQVLHKFHQPEPIKTVLHGGCTVRSARYKSFKMLISLAS